ncbi:ndt80 like dna-binding family protein [Lichtheimia corymbifera JMRC:FSU:9682]|uniref:Ndt80 like dna-binding family protein n=1 Tax=Lichtheimia corymbifera JMRC:FSU:9682 TaxID=1263082 RepID=A0A068RWF0_9FUNG|nr:ndt80 like dna-binding family protein [Lichtheimia corymbifera JMRC:FSU:9682]
MNPVNDSKEWQADASSDAALQYPAMDHGYPMGAAPVHPPIHQHPSYPPQSPMNPVYKPEHQHPVTTPQPDPRLSAGPPRPTPAKSTGTMPSPTRTYSSPPYPSISTPPGYRKRGRSDSLFPPETGPFFSSTKPLDNLFALDRTSLVSVRIHSKMDRGFFLADNDWTCYRRNYFQVSSAFSIHGIGHYYADHEPPCLVRSEDGLFYPVRRFLLGISARVSNSDKRIELVQHTPKRDKGPQTTPQAKPITPGGNLSMSSVGGANQNIVTFERIQFKTATANNGKRRAAQQYYVAVVELYAETDQGEQIKVASCQSAPLVVRGRSPGHYTDSQQERMPGAGLGAAPSPLSPTHPEDHHRFFPPRGYAAPPPPPPPAAMMGEYGSPYGAPPPPPPPHAATAAYYPAPPPPPPHHHHHHHHPYMNPGMVMSPVASPTTTQPPPLPAPQTHHHQHPHSSPYHQQHHPYMVGNAAAAPPPPGNGTMPSPTPGEFAAPHPIQQDDKLSHPGTPTTTVNYMDAVAANDWNARSRMNSAGSLPPPPPPTSAAAAAYFQHHQPTAGTLSSNASTNSAFSPTTPTTPYVSGARKYPDQQHHHPAQSS